MGEPRGAEAVGELVAVLRPATPSGLAVSGQMSSKLIDCLNPSAKYPQNRHGGDTAATTEIMEHSLCSALASIVENACV